MENILHRVNGEEVRQEQPLHLLRYSSVVLPLSDEKRPLFVMPGVRRPLSVEDLLYSRRLFRLIVNS